MRRAATVVALVAGAVSVRAGAQVIPIDSARARPAADWRPAPSHSGLTVGLLTIGGERWDPTGLEAGLLFTLGPSHRRALHVAARFGGYTSPSGFHRDMRGWYAGLAVGYRTQLVSLFEVGRGSREHEAVLNGTIEVSANLDHDAPSPDAAHATAAWLFELTVLNGRPLSETLALVTGPVVFAGGRQTNLRWHYGMRYQVPFRK